METPTPDKVPPENDVTLRWSVAVMLAFLAGVVLTIAVMMLLQSQR